MKHLPILHLGIISLLAGYFFDVAFFTPFFTDTTPQGLTFFVVQMIFLGVLTFSALITKKQLHTLWYVCGALSLTAALAPFVTHATIGLAVSGTSITVLNLFLLIMFLNEKHIPTTLLETITWGILQPLAKIMQSVVQLFTYADTFWKKQSNQGRAIIIGVPITGIVLLILSAADPLLGEIRSAILRAIPDAMFIHLVLIFWMALGVFITLLASTIPETKTIPHTTNTSSSISWGLILTLLNIPLALFALSQLTTYLLQNAGALEFVRTYSAYAITGVAEACIATILCGSIALFAWSRETHPEKVLFIQTSILAGMLVIITLIAEVRVLHYIQAFGLTPLRILGFLGIIALLVCIMSSSFFLLVRKNALYAVHASMLTAIIFLVLVPLVQLDKQSMKYNIARATPEHPLDATLIDSLSLEAYPAFFTARETHVPIENSLVLCQQENKELALFTEALKTVTQQKRWIDSTLPAYAFTAFAATHSAPTTCRKSQ